MEARMNKNGTGSEPELRNAGSLEELAKTGEQDVLQKLLEGTKTS